MRRKQKTEEQKIAEKLANLVTDVRVDLDQVGIYIAREQPNTVFNRLMIVAEAAEWEKVETNDNYI